MPTTQELDQLLNGLLADSGRSRDPVRGYEQLERRQGDLQSEISAAESKLEQVRDDRQLLQSLLDSADFDREMAQRDYPSRLLKGPINLESHRQKAAIAELAITLQNDAQCPLQLLKLTKAIHAYYQEHDADLEPLRVQLKKARSALDQFRKNPDQGADPEYREYLLVKRKLQQMDEGELNVDRLLEDEPEFQAGVELRFLKQAKNKDLKAAILKRETWQPHHRDALEAWLEEEKDHDFIVRGLEILEGCGGVAESFANSGLSRTESIPAFQDWFSRRSEEEQNEIMRKAAGRGLDRLFDLAVQSRGPDSEFFYSGLKTAKAHPEVFKTMLSSLFVKGTARGSYGLDPVYASKVMQEQKELPRNILATVQKAFPRGLEGELIFEAIELLKGYSQEIEVLLPERSLYERGVLQRDRSYIDLNFRIGQLEAVRFTMFTLIHDRLVQDSKYQNIQSSKRQPILDFIQVQNQFELERGGNPHILKYCEDLISLLESQKNRTSND